MYREIKRNDERERLVRSMASKLATGNGIEVIASSRRKKRARTVIYLGVPVILFIIAGIVISVKSPGTAAIAFKSGQPSTSKVNLIQLIHQDLEIKKITVNQYAFYLRDILIRYDSLPSQYRPARPVATTENIYDSLCAVWSKIDLKNRAQLLKELPKIEEYLREFQYKTSNRTE